MLLRSESIELRALEPTDGSAIMSILNVPSVSAVLFGFPAKAPDMAFEDWLAAAAHRKNDFYFAVINRQSNELVGICAYQDIDYRNGRITVWAAMAGDGKAQVITLLAVNAFMHLRMEYIALPCLIDDTDTAAAAEAVGFTRDAIFYSRIKKSGKSTDVLLYTLLKGEEGDT